MQEAVVWFRRNQWWPRYGRNRHPVKVGMLATEFALRRAPRKEPEIPPARAGKLFLRSE